METKQTSPHLGRKIGRIREMLGVKQETLAEKLSVTQQAVSKIEQQEQIETPTLERIAKALGISVEAIKNFSEENANNFVNNFNDNSTNNGALNNYHCVFNPIEKWLEAMEENKRLYEALLKSEREKIATLEKQLNKQ